MRIIRVIEEIIFIIIRVSCIPLLIRKGIAANRVTIINYHDPDPECLRKHIQYYLKYYSIIGINQLAEALYSGEIKALPPYSLVITFDDGHIGNRKIFELLKEKDIPVTIYLVSEALGSKRKYWWKTNGLGADQRELLKKVPDDHRRKYLADNFNYCDNKDYPTGDALSNEDVCKFVSDGGNIGSHSSTHPILTLCSEEILIQEINNSKIKLESIIGNKINHFCYPNGNWNLEISKKVREAGYLTARSTRIGWVTKNSNPFILPNMGISDNASVNKMVIQISGIYGVLLKGFNSYRWLYKLLMKWKM